MCETGFWVCSIDHWSKRDLFQIYAQTSWYIGRYYQNSPGKNPYEVDIEMSYQECGIHPVHLATDQEIVWRNHQKLKSLFQISRGACHAMAFFHMVTICNVTVSKDESWHYLMIVGIPCPSGWSTKWLDVHIAALCSLAVDTIHTALNRLSLPCIVCRWYANTWHEDTRHWKTRHWKD